MNRVLTSLLILSVYCAGVEASGPKVPMLYSTDLFHPHRDPDDHYDLATLFALDEFDVKGIILDLGAEQKKQIGRPPVEQMLHITGRPVPYAVGLSQRFRSRADKALEEPAEFQGAVELILSVLRASKEKVVITTTGSCRDVAAAFNREPDLLKEKVKAVYFNIGRGPNESQNECNVGYDPNAYLRLFESGLPIYWCPCFGKDGYETLYYIDEAIVVGACAPPVRNYFTYCLTQSKADPIEFLATGPHPLPKGKRNMFCTGPMFHAAGRKIYQRGPDDFVALSAAKAQEAGLTGKEVDVFRFVPMHATVNGARSESAVKLPQPEPGKLAAAYADRTKDRVGTGTLEPDGRADCCVRVVGLAPDEPIKNVILTGPKEGRWEQVETGRWWRVVCDRRKGELDCFFQFYAAGPHRIEIVYARGASQSAEFEVPAAAETGLHVSLDAAEPNGFVFRSTDPRYQQILASCLKNLLAGLKR
jgi:hypothetical protein